MNDVINNERQYMGEFHSHADILLDNLEDIKDIFDEYLAVKLYNWRYKWFCEHYDDWTIENYESDCGEITVDVIPYNVCMNWQSVLEKYFDDVRPIKLPICKHYSDICRSKLDNEGIVQYYFRCNIPIPNEFEEMLDDQTATNEDGDKILMDNLSVDQLEDFEKEMIDYDWI